jgi:uncharacterized protein
LTTTLGIVAKAPQDTLDLGRLALASGEGRRLDLAVDPGRFELGGETYAPADPPADARLDLSRTAAGHAFRLRFAVKLAGPCVRCLEAGQVEIEVDAREVHQEGAGDEELLSPYVSGDELRLAEWAHDALALAMPERFLCRPDCAGLCPVCGESLNDADPERHRHEPDPDPRWEKLRELKLE